MKGSVSTPMNWFIALKVVCCEPVAVSPEVCDSAAERLLPVRPNSATKPGGSAPPLLKKLLSVDATVCGLPGSEVPAPSEAVRFSNTSDSV